MRDLRRTDDAQGKIVHACDGIEEADNAIPTWWLAIFYISAIFAVAYWFYYHEFEIGPGSYEAYRADMAKRAGSAPIATTPEELEALSLDPEAVAAGQASFQAVCVACHGSQAEGKIGPNLTDAFWMHGGGTGDIHKAISEGVVSKGMPAWRLNLGADKVANLTAYVLSVRDTHLAGKEPQGQRYVPPVPSAAPLPSGAASADPTVAPDAAASAAAAH